MKPPWQPMNTAPKDGTKIDIVGKSWTPATDRFEYRRFHSCSWMVNHWNGFPALKHKAVAWMSIPQFDETDEE